MPSVLFPEFLGAQRGAMDRCRLSSIESAGWFLQRSLFLASPSTKVLPLSHVVTEGFFGRDLEYEFGWWPFAVGAVTHVVFFLYWQQFRQLLPLKTLYVFIDKVLSLLPLLPRRLPYTGAVTEIAKPE